MINIAEKHKNDVAKLREFRQKVLQSTDYLQKLINNVLDISKLESGSLMLEYKSFDLVELLNNNMTVVAMSAYENGVRFEGGVEANTIRHRYLIGSPVHLSRVLMNLASNAIKYNHAGGSVTVSMQQENHQVLLHIADTGCGISEEYRESIFQPFFRVDKSRSRQMGGVGLGLALVKEIAVLHGGSVCVESSSEEGTTFAVRLPLPKEKME